MSVTYFRSNTVLEGARIRKSFFFTTRVTLSKISLRCCSRHPPSVRCVDWVSRKIKCGPAVNLQLQSALTLSDSLYKTWLAKNLVTFMASLETSGDSWDPLPAAVWAEFNHPWKQNRATTKLQLVKPILPVIPSASVCVHPCVLRMQCTHHQV